MNGLCVSVEWDHYKSSSSANDLFKHQVSRWWLLELEVKTYLLEICKTIKTATHNIPQIAEQKPPWQSLSNERTRRKQGKNIFFSVYESKRARRYDECLVQLFDLLFFFSWSRNIIKTAETCWNLMRIYFVFQLPRWTQWGENLEKKSEESSRWIVGKRGKAYLSSAIRRRMKNCFQLFNSRFIVTHPLFTPALLS